MRVRDIVHASGRRLRIELDRTGGEEGVTIQLSDPASPASGPILLDLYGGELLASFVMNARLAAPAGGLAEERCGGPLGCRFRLAPTGSHRAVIELHQMAEVLTVPQFFWDRLYAELTLALVHGRHLQRAGHRTAEPLHLGARLLH